MLVTFTSSALQSANARQHIFCTNLPLTADTLLTSPQVSILGHFLELEESHHSINMVLSFKKMLADQYAED